MKVIRYAFWAVVGLCLIAVGIANRGMVTLHAMPSALADLFGVSPDIELPLFVVILIGVAAGLLLGFVWEWLREAQQRAQHRARGRELDALKRELGRLQSEKHEGRDEVLALIDTAPASR